MAEVAQHIAFKEPQGGLAYFFYREGRAPVDPHPLFVHLRSLLIKLPADIEFAPEAI